MTKVLHLEILKKTELGIVYGGRKFRTRFFRQSLEIERICFFFCPLALHTGSGGAGPGDPTTLGSCPGSAGYMQPCPIRLNLITPSIS